MPVIFFVLRLDTARDAFEIENKKEKNVHTFLYLFFDCWVALLLILIFKKEMWNKIIEKNIERAKVWTYKKGKMNDEDLFSTWKWNEEYYLAPKN